MNAKKAKRARKAARDFCTAWGFPRFTLHQYIDQHHTKRGNMLIGFTTHKDIFGKEYQKPVVVPPRIRVLQPCARKLYKLIKTGVHPLTDTSVDVTL